MRERRVQCMVWHIVNLEVFAEIPEKIGIYEEHYVDEYSASNNHAHRIQSLSTLFIYFASRIFASDACRFVEPLPRSTVGPH